MLLSSLTYNTILNYGLNRSSFFELVGERLALAILDENDNINLLDATTADIGTFQTVFSSGLDVGQEINVGTRTFTNNLSEVQIASHVAILSSSGQILGFTELFSLKELPPDSDLILPSGTINFDLEDINTQILNQIQVELSASGFSELNDFIDLSLTNLTIYGTASGQSSLVSSVSLSSEATASGIASLLGNSDGTIVSDVVVGTATGESTLTASAEGDVVSTATATGQLILTSSAEGDVVSTATANADLTLIGSSAGGTVPVNTVAPVVTDNDGGDPLVGDTLSVSTGTWLADPVLQPGDFTYQWRRTTTATGTAIDWIAAPVNSNSPHTAETDGGLVKDSGAASWTNSAFVADNQDFTADGTIEFTAGNTSSFSIIGLTDDPGSSASTRYTSYDFGIFFQSTINCQILLNGAFVQSDTYTDSDVFSIRRTGTTVEWLKNGSVIRTETGQTTNTLTPVASVYSGSFATANTGSSSTQVNIGTNQNTYTLLAADADADIDCIVTVNNGFGGDVESTSNQIGPVIAPSGWTDATGLSWDAAWDFTDTSSGPIPALSGDVDLSLVSGAYSTGTPPATVDLTGLGLANNGYVEMDTSLFRAQVPSVLNLDPTHIRIVCQINPTLGEIFRINTTSSGVAIRAYTLGSPERLVLAFIRDGSTWGQRVINVVFDRFYVIDIYLSSNPSNLLEAEIYTNGHFDTVTVSGITFDGLTNDDTVELSSTSSDTQFAFFGVRGGSFSQSQHDDAVEAILDGVVIDGRDYIHYWDYSTLVNATDTLNDLGTSTTDFNLPILSGDGAVNSSTLGASSAAIGSSRVDQAVISDSVNRLYHRSGGTYDPLLINNAFTLRFIMDYHTPASNRTILQVGRYIGGNEQTQMQVRLRTDNRWETNYSSQDDQGNFSTVVAVENSVGSLTTLVLVDVVVEPFSTSGTTIRLYTDGAEESDSDSNTTFQGLQDVINSLHFHQPDVDQTILFVGLIDGAISEHDHLHDAGLLGVGT